MTPIELSLVTPGYNEAEKISENLLAMQKALEEYIGQAWELIFVNDGSTDDTEKRVAKLAEQEPRIKLVSYKNNGGRGYALRQGIRQAQGKFILTAESDLNYGVKIIKELYEAIKGNNFDIIVALNLLFKRGTLFLASKLFCI